MRSPSRSSSLIVAIAVLLGAEMRAGAQETSALQSGRELAKARKFQDAIVEFGKAIQENPQSAEAFFERGKSFADMQKTDRPLEDFAEAIRLKPDYAEAWYMRGHIYARKGDHPHAIENFTEAIRLRPDHADAWHYRGISHFERNEIDLAWHDFDKAIELNPKLGEAYFFRAQAARRTGRLDEALQDLEEAIRLNPRKAKWIYERGQVFMWLGDDKRAIADYTEAMRLDPKTQHYYNDRASIYSHQGHHDLAIVDLTEAIRLQPKLPFFRQNRGVNYLAIGELDKALADFNEAIRLTSDWGRYYVWRARAYFRLKQNELALADLEHAGKLPSPDDLELSFLRGNVYADFGEHERAITAFDEAIRQQPSFANAFVNRANSRTALGKPDEAFTDLKAALRLDPENVYALNCLGSFYSRKRDLARAVAEYTKAIEAGATFPDSYYNRFLANARLGKWTELKSDGEHYIALKGWVGEKPIYVALIRAVAERRQDESAAHGLLVEALEKGDRATWPYPVLRALEGGLAAGDLFQQCADNDQLTESRAYVGLFLSSAGKRDDAAPHLRWVNEHGNKSFIEYDLSLAELQRLEPKN